MRILALAAVLTALWAPAQARPRDVRAPVVVELFTAQGCAECPTANALIGALADRPGVIALTFPVDYWDYLGWKDTLARPEFSARQKAYQTSLRLRDIYTPQVIIGGSEEVSGVKAETVRLAVDKARRRNLDLPIVHFQKRGGRVAVGSGGAPRGGAVVWLVRYDEAVREVEVKRGENRGQVVRQDNVVRELVRLGEWRGSARLFRLPHRADAEPGDADLKTVILIQAVRSGRILAAGRL